VVQLTVYNGIPYQVKQEAGELGITAENMEKSQHTNFNKDTTDKSASVACSNVGLRLWKLDTQKEWRNTSWHLWDEGAEKDSAGFVDSKENKWVEYYLYYSNKAGVLFIYLLLCIEWSLHTREMKYKQ